MLEKKRAKKNTPKGEEMKEDGEDDGLRKKKKGSGKKDKDDEQAVEEESQQKGKDEQAADEVKDKNAKLMADPRYKTGTKINALSPQGQANLKEVRRLCAIENSNAWHKQNPKGKVKVGAGGDTAAEEDKPNDEIAEAGSSSSKPAKNSTLKDAKVTWLT